MDKRRSLLTVITARRCINRAEHHQAKCRTAAVEVHRGREYGLPDGLDQIIDGKPTPLEAAILPEIVVGLMRSLDADDGDITKLILRRYSTPEIGERLWFAERTDDRVKTRAKQRMRPMNAEYTHLS
jgi:hypothetical protein